MLYLVSSYSGAMRRLCAVYARSPQDREDLFQDIFLAIWKALPAFRSEASERTWLYRIAHNVALTWQAKDRSAWTRRRKAMLPWIRDDRSFTNWVSRLPPVDRQLVSLWLEGLNTNEMGEITGIRARHRGGSTDANPADPIGSAPDIGG